jgi:Concanavalin A-like lectin/glucanases superfamily/IPT/TIG domain/Phosphoesterase family
MRKLGFIGSCLLLGVSLGWPLQGAAAAQNGKLVVIVMENNTYNNIVGSSQAPYLNQLIAQGRLFTDYQAVASGSNPNYLAMTSGLTSAQSPPAQNIFQAIDGSGTSTWKEFMESMPGNCASGGRPVVPGTSVPLYTSDHDPDYQYRANTTCSTNDVPMTDSTFNPASLPDLSYIVPNECDDMHTLPASGQACPAYFGSNPGTSLINMGDNWLATVVPSLLAQPNVTVLITWDEGTTSSTPWEHVAALEAGAGVTAGSVDGNAYNHYSLEAGLYRYLGLGTAPNAGATATPLPIPSPAGASAPTISSFTPTSGTAGSTVTINGSALTGATAVRFNGVAANFTVTSGTQLTATVPIGASTGPIAVDTSAGTATSPDSFIVPDGGTSPPAAPTNLTASPSASTVNLSWTDSDTTVSYQLDRSSDPDFGTHTSVSLPAGTTSYKDSGLASAVYYYRLAAVNSGGQSPYVSAGAATLSYTALVAGRPGQLARWRLGETSGTAASDTTGSYNGSYVNGPVLGSPGAIAADPNTSVTFNGTNQRVTLPSLPSAGDFSIEGWTDLANSSVNNNTLYGGSGTVRLLARPGTGPTAAYAGVTLNGTEYVLQPLNPAPNLNTWVYWVLARQGGTLTLYRDGVQIAQRTDLPATATANINGYIASQNNNLYYLNGGIDDVAIYTSALTPSTITSHYQAALYGPAPS